MKKCPGENKGPVGRISKTHFESFLYEVNNICKKFLSKAVENIKNIQKEVQENNEYKAIQDMEGEVQI